MSENTPQWEAWHATKFTIGKKGFSQGDHCVAFVNGFHQDAEKNAALLAAAPDLLDALKSLVAYAYHQHHAAGSDPEMKHACDVIAKATGEDADEEDDGMCECGRKSHECTTADGYDEHHDRDTNMENMEDKRPRRAENGHPDA